MMFEKPTKEYGVYYWDTFEGPGEGTSLVGESDTFQGANAFVLREYGSKIRSDGADRVQIVHFVNGDGTVVATFNVG